MTSFLFSIATWFSEVVHEFDWSKQETTREQFYLLLSFKQKCTALVLLRKTANSVVNTFDKILAYEQSARIVCKKYLPLWLTYTNHASLEWDLLLKENIMYSWRFHYCYQIQSSLYMTNLTNGILFLPNGDRSFEIAECIVNIPTSDHAQTRRNNTAECFSRFRMNVGVKSFKLRAHLDWSLALLCISLVVPLKDIRLFSLTTFLLLFSCYEHSGSVIK